MTTKTHAIRPANIAALQAIVDAATKAGEIDTDALKSMAETVHRENRMLRNAAYLAGKDILPIEKARVAKLMKTMSRNDERALEKMAAPYKRGDLLQMIGALKAKPLSQMQARVVASAEAELDRVYGDAVGPRWKLLADAMANHGLDTKALKTVRIEKKQPVLDADRTSLAHIFPMPA